jgi:outer membrane lipoprotein carrier protein
MATKCSVILMVGCLVLMTAFPGHAADGSASDDFFKQPEKGRLLAERQSAEPPGRRGVLADADMMSQNQPTASPGSESPSKKAPHIGLRDVISALETPFKNRKIEDYTAKFFQESRIASLDRQQRASGEVRVRFDYRNGSREAPMVMFHWRYEQPTRQELVSNGKTMWVYLPENNQVIQSDIKMASQAQENDPMTFLTGLGNLSRDFQISYAEPNQDAAGNYVLALQPRRTTTLINRMIIVVGRSAAEASAANSGALIFPILSTTIYDPNDNSTTIEFSDLRVNRGISAGQFNFTIPPGVEVVQPTGKELGF